MKKENIFPASPELLVPAGSYDSLVAAIEGGADAVYLAAKRFGARASAKNFDISELERGIALARKHGVKTHITMNTALYDRELGDFLESAKELYRLGADAFIIADLGAAAMIKRELPHMELHASTQMGINNTEGAKAALELGCSRVVLARELSFGDIKRITDEGIPSEIFLHGALCVSVSGQCLFSSLVGGRSGNRGECAQPCRLPYEGGYPLSLKDNCLASCFLDVLKTGAISLKIEGRMKPPEYVYGVSRLYRSLIDERRNATEDEIAELSRLFSRSGFTSAYFSNKDKSGMVGIRTEADKRKTGAVATYSCGIDTSLTEEELAAAKRQPMQKGGAALIKDAVLTKDATPIKEEKAAEKSKLFKKKSFVYFENRSTYEGVSPILLENKLVFMNIYELSRLTEAKHGDVSGICPALPAVYTDEEEKDLLPALIKAKESGALYCMAETLAGAALAKKAGLSPFAGYRFNLTNKETAKYLSSIGICGAVASAEAILPQIRDMQIKEMPIYTVAYGRMPLMTLTRCVIKDKIGCDRCKKGERTELTDRTGERFPLMPYLGHRNLLLNSRPTYIGDMAAEIKKNGIYYEGIYFFCEKGKEAERVLLAFESGSPLDVPVRRAGVKTAKNAGNNADAKGLPKRKEKAGNDPGAVAQSRSKPYKEAALRTGKNKKSSNNKAGGKSRRVRKGR